MMDEPPGNNNILLQVKTVQFSSSCTVAHVRVLCALNFLIAELFSKTLLTFSVIRNILFETKLHVFEDEYVHTCKQSSLQYQHICEFIEALFSFP